MVIDQSFGIIRTNVALTTNVKLIVDSNRNLWLDSINSVPQLEDQKFKKYPIKQNTTYNKSISDFWNNTTTDVSYTVKYLNDSDTCYTDFKYQIDDIYFSGASEISDNNLFDEEFEYFAPLYYSNHDFPEQFIIFRVDGSGNIELTKDNFRENIISEFKIVDMFDLLSDGLGDFIKLSFTENNLPINPIDINLGNQEFARWYGIDYESGNFLYNSKFITDIFSKDTTYSQADKLLTNGFKDSKIIYPNIINFSFLFNDVPATKNSLRKWSLNRYFGFYGTKKIYKNFTFFKPAEFISNINQTKINIDANNVFVDPATSNPINPFYRYKSNLTYYIEYLGEFYLVVNSGKQFKIISDISLENKISEINQSIIDIDSDNILFFDYRYFGVNNYDGSSLYSTGDSALFNIIDNFESADVWFIEINNKSHRIIKQENKYVLKTDSGFENIGNIFKTIVNNKSISIDMEDITVSKKPFVVSVYSFSFNQIKDFDTDILNTGFAGYEYEKVGDITFSEEPKLFKEEIDNTALDTYIYKSEAVNVPCGSEFSSTWELFEIVQDYKNNFDINTLWRKNSEQLKWGFINSISNNDYSYRFNLANRDVFNRTTDIVKAAPTRYSKNLDYFYTVGTLSETFINQTLNINKELFNLNSYITGETDYFNSWFGNKYSKVNQLNDTISNHTLFRGIKFSFFNKNNIIFDENNTQIKNILINPINDFNNYKFSIIASPMSHSLPDLTSIDISQYSWQVIEQWESGKIYDTNNFVFYTSDRGEQVYICQYPDATKSIIPPNDPSSNFIIYQSSKSISPFTVFWNSYKTYNTGDIVIYKSEYYISLLAGNFLDLGIPDVSSEWQKIPLFDKNKSDAVYILNGEVVQASNLQTIFTIVPKKGKAYGVFNGSGDSGGNSDVLLFNSKYYVYTGTVPVILDNGINIFINKQHKNILIQIYYNDALVNLMNIKRDDMYSFLYNALTAKNFIDTINFLNVAEFINPINYYIIDTELNQYDITTTPYVVKCDYPNSIRTEYDTLQKIPVTTNIIVNNKLQLNEINNLSEIDWYDGSSLGVMFKNKSTGNFNMLYRYDGGYIPIFKDLLIFKNEFVFDTDNSNFGIISEQIISKVSNKQLFNNKNQYKNIFPQIDYIGYSVIERFIFSSTFDKKYYILFT